MDRGFQSELKKWFNTKAGKTVFLQEKSRIDAVVNNLFGYFLVQLGHPSEGSLLASSRIGTKLIIDSEAPSKSALIANLAEQGSEHVHWIQADFDFLPLAPDSVDLVLLPHALEEVDDPYYLLRQVDSMLVGEGHIVVAGFNPAGCLSIWLKHIVQPKGFETAKFRRASKIKEWLEVLGYEVEKVKYTPVMCFTASEKFKRWGRVIEKIERSLQWMGFEFGNIYCIVAKKKVDAPTLVGAKWHLPRWSRAKDGSVVSQRFKPHKKQLETIKKER